MHRGREAAWLAVAGRGRLGPGRVLRAADAARDLTYTT